MRVFCGYCCAAWVQACSCRSVPGSIAVITAEPAGKASFVYSYMQTRLMTHSLVCVSKPRYNNNDGYFTSSFLPSSCDSWCYLVGLLKYFGNNSEELANYPRKCSLLWRGNILVRWRGFIAKTFYRFEASENWDPWNRFRGMLFSNEPVRMSRKRMRARGWKIGVELPDFVIEMSYLVSKSFLFNQNFLCLIKTFTMIWLVKWGKIIVLHVRHAL